MARGVHVATLAGALAIGCSTLVGADFDVTLAAGGASGAGAHGPVASSAASAAGGSTSSGGAATSTASTNAGPSSGVGGCGDSMSNCGSCFGCVTQSGACKDQENACNDGSGCEQIVDCVTTCMSLPCVNACTLNHKPDAVQAFYQLYACRCSQCPSCVAACGLLHCFNGVQDGDETGTDCGGDNASAGCLLCNGANCIEAGQCKSGYCSRQNVCG